MEKMNQLIFPLRAVHVCFKRCLILWWPAILLHLKSLCSLCLCGEEKHPHSLACRAGPVAPEDGIGVSGNHRAGVRDKPDPFRVVTRVISSRGGR